MLENQKLFDVVDGLEDEMVDALMALIRVPSMGPENGGDGELAKAEVLLEILKDVGFDRIERFDAPDPRVSSGVRPNVVAYCDGEADVERVWVVSHLDVVPPGEVSLWTVAPPFEPLLKDGRVYGLGSEDNLRSVVASVFAAKALKRLGLKPKRAFCLAIVSDEERGSQFGIQHLIGQGLFRENDLVVVPDGGTADGGFVEVAEKSILWFKVRTVGRQVHASLPNQGLNAHRVGMQLAVALDKVLHEKYSFADDTFNEPLSTFEPTKKEKNVDAVNIVPGEDVLSFDCRILPRYNVDEVLGDIEKVIGEFESKTAASIELEILQKEIAPEIDVAGSKVVALLKQALKEARGLTARVGGIGGGTCAAFFRRAGIPAVVWSTIDEVLHRPNEYADVKAMVDDAKIFALIAMK